MVNLKFAGATKKYAPYFIFAHLSTNALQKFRLRC